MIFMPRSSANRHPFWISPTELTIGEYASITQRSIEVVSVEYDSIVISNVDDLSTLPMISSGNNNFKDYFQSINHNNNLNNGIGYRFATPAEWNRSCINPDSSTTFYWGNQSFSEAVKLYAWYSMNADSKIWTLPHAPYSGPQPVGQLLPNEYGLFDMFGNVNELVVDRKSYDSDYLSGEVYWTGGNIYCQPDGLKNTISYHEQRPEFPVLSGTRTVFGQIY